MSDDFAYAMFRIYQHQARDVRQQYNLEQIYLMYVAGAITAEQYERNLALTCAAKLRADTAPTLSEAASASGQVR